MYVHVDLRRYKGKIIMASGLRNLQKLWQPVIGLEIHAQLASRSKLFSGAGTSFFSRTNTQVSHFDAALPGTLPVLNRGCVELGLRVALALNSDVQLESHFDRKHYFYADLPAGFQITQQRRPLATGGAMPFMWEDESSGQVERGEAKIIQVQLEQDSGKSLHDPEHHLSYIDLNRAGVGLVEIVTAPSFCSGQSAAAFVFELRALLIGIGACKGDMSKGELRVDANVSVRRPGDPLGVRSEVKNLNSLRAVRRAIEFEIERHIGLLAAGQPVSNETRSFDPESERTLAMRDKEKLQDYRYCPEPNLPPLRLQQSCEEPQGCSENSPVCVACVRRALPAHLPTLQRHWLTYELNVSLGQSDTMLENNGFFEFLLEALRSAGHNVTLRDDNTTEEVAQLGRELVYWLTGHCLGELRKVSLQSDLLGDLMTPAQLLSVAQGRLSGRLEQGEAKTTISGWIRAEEMARDREAARRCCEQTLEEEAETLALVRAGKKKKARFLLRKALEKDTNLDVGVVAAVMVELLDGHVTLKELWLRKKGK